MENSPLVDGVNAVSTGVQPTYLNLDYLFYQVFLIGQFFKSLFVVRGGFSGLLAGIKIFVAVLCLFLIVVILYSLVRLWEIKEEKESAQREKEKKDASIAPPPSPAGTVGLPVAPIVNTQWEQVLAHANSTQQNDWRLAIIEADSMLDDMTKKMRFNGDTLGERLKNAPRGGFDTIDLAWEAHKRRNRIAHEGLSYDLSHTETSETIELYKAVFKEFSVI